MWFRLLLLALASSLIISFGCAPINVQHSYDNFTKFSQLRTYRWSAASLRAGEPRNTNYPAIHAQIRRAVEHRMALSGFTKVDSGAVDFIAHYIVAQQDQTRTLTKNITARGDTPIIQTVDVGYREGSLVLEMLTPDERRVLWRGWAKSEISPDLNPREIYPKIDQGVADILAYFPPK